MEFKEMKKIWDKQNKKTMYAINIESLENSIRIKRNNTNRRVEWVEIILITLNFLVGPFLIYDAVVDQDNAVAYVIAVFFIISGFYLLISRFKRINRSNSFAKTTINLLDDAIANADYMITISRKVLYWYGIPIFLLVFMKLAIAESSLWVLILMAGIFVLSYVLGRWELNRCHLPRKERLIKLKKQLVELEKSDPLTA